MQRYNNFLNPTPNQQQMSQIKLLNMFSKTSNQMAEALSKQKNKRQQEGIINTHRIKLLQIIDNLREIERQNLRSHFADIKITNLDMQRYIRKGKLKHRSSDWNKLYEESYYQSSLSNESIETFKKLVIEKRAMIPRFSAFFKKQFPLSIPKISKFLTQQRQFLKRCMQRSLVRLNMYNIHLIEQKKNDICSLQDQFILQQNTYKFIPGVNNHKILHQLIDFVQISQMKIQSLTLIRTNLPLIIYKQIFSKFTELIRIQIFRIKLTIKEVSIIKEELKFDNLRYLSLQQNSLDFERIKDLRVNKFKCLSYLNLSRNRIKNRGVAQLVKGNWPELKVIEIFDCGLTIDVFNILNKAHWPSLVKIKLSQMNYKSNYMFAKIFRPFGQCQINAYGKYYKPDQKDYYKYLPMKEPMKEETMIH